MAVHRDSHAKKGLKEELQPFLNARNNFQILVSERPNSRRIDFVPKQKLYTKTSPNASVFFKGPHKKRVVLHSGEQRSALYADICMSAPEGSILGRTFTQEKILFLARRRCFSQQDREKRLHMTTYRSIVPNTYDHYIQRKDLYRITKRISMVAIGVYIAIVLVRLFFNFVRLLSIFD